MILPVHLTLLFLATFYSGFVYYGEGCLVKEQTNLLNNLLYSCPRPFDSQDKTFCCTNVRDGSSYCCTVAEYGIKAGVDIVIPIAISAAFITAIIFCISCLCCRCCPFYRRRREGVIYGRVERPVVTIVQTPSVVQPAEIYPTNPNACPPYLIKSQGMPQPPPSYTNEGYTQQSSYNPNY